MSDAPEPERGALYNRYRPTRLAEVVGQDETIAPLRRALEKGRAHHAYLLSGPAGCGKTSTARILAAALLCDRAPVADPCGECAPCQSVARGTCVDLMEIDAASNGSVDDARDLREKVGFAPVQSRVKVIIVDEAHMVTTAGFNALLKVVEEPPPFVYFIFATTEPDKVIGTIRSRTYNYRFRSVGPRVLAEHLVKVAGTEGGAIEDAALPLLVRAANGSVRNALGLLGQLLDGSFAGRISRDEVAGLLGATSDTALDALIAALADRNTAGMLLALGAALDEGADAKRLGEDLLDRIRDLLVLATTGQMPLLAEISGPDAIAGWRDAATRIGQRGLTVAAECLTEALRNLPGGQVARIALEVACSRIQIALADTVDLPGMVTRLERAIASAGVPGSRPVPLVPAVDPTAVAPAPDAVRLPDGPQSGGSVQPMTDPYRSPTSVGEERIAEYREDARHQMLEAGEDPDREVFAAAVVGTGPVPEPADAATGPEHTEAVPVAPPAAAAPAEPVDEWAPPADLGPETATTPEGSAVDPWAPPASDTPAAPASSGAPAPAGSGPVHAGAWERVMDAVDSKVTRSLMSSAQVVRLADGQIALRFDSPGMLKRAQSSNHLALCAQAASTVLGGTWTVTASDT